MPCAGDRVGQTGVEKTYDKYLRGRSGEKLQRVNSVGAKVDKPPVVDGAADHRRTRAADDRHLAPAGGRAGAPVRHPPRACGQPLARERRRDRRDEPEQRRDPRDGVRADLQAGIFVGRTDPKKLAPLLDPATAKEDNYPGLNRVTEGLYPPGSTFKPVTALAAMQERLISPYQTLQCTPKFEVHGQVVQELGPVRERADDAPAGARRLVRHLLLQPRLLVLRAPARPGPPAPGLGEPVRVRRADRASTSGPSRRPAADARVAAGHVHEEDRPVLLADRPALEARRLDPARDRPEGPARHAAADGALLRADRERRQARHAAHRRRRSRSRARPRRRCTAQPARRPRRATSTRPRSPSSGTASTARRTPRTAPRRPSSASFPIPVAGKTGTAEKVVQPPGYATPLLQDQSWWCGYAPAEKPEIAVCAVIENGGHGGTAAAPAALKVFEHYFHKHRAADRRHPLRLMADHVYTADRAVRAPRHAGASSPRRRRCSRGSTGSCSAPSPGSSRYGLWAISGITQHDVLGNPDYYVYRQFVFIAVGGSALVARDPDRPRLYRRFQKHVYLGTLVLFVFVFLAGTVARGSRRWIDLGFFRFQPSEFGKLLIVLALAGFLADRMPRRRVAGGDDDRARAAAAGARLHPAGHRLGARLRRGALRRPVRGRHPLAPPRDPRAVAACSCSCVLWCLPAAGIARAEAVPEGPADRLPPPRQGPERADYNVTQSITAVGSGGADRQGRAGATQTNLNYLPEHATDFAFASLAEQQGFLGAGSC